MGRISTGKGGKQSQEGKGRRSGKAFGVGGGKDLNRERVQMILGRNREKISAGGKALGGKGGKGSQQGRGGNDLREEREKILGGKRP